ncbi:hypothetical protein [Escherichia phage vB-Eco-KMB37]|nr:hypothetical protein [Escherichia phage vB-Eco-KMB37]
MQVVGLEPTKPRRAGDLQSPAIAAMRYLRVWYIVKDSNLRPWS